MKLVRLVLAVLVLALVAGPSLAVFGRRHTAAVKVEVKKVVAPVVVEKKTVTTEFEAFTEVTAETVRTVRGSRPAAVVVVEKKLVFKP